MKYFTKEWYGLMQSLDYCICKKPIADKEYSDDDIRALYDRELKREIAREKRAHNAPPEFVPYDLDGDVDLDDFVMFDAQTGNLKKFESVEQIRAAYEEEKAAAMKEYDERPPFDPTETIEMFKLRYEGGLEHELDRLPEWAKPAVDVRLAALGYFTESVYDKLKAEAKANEREFKKINRAAEKALAAQAEKLPESITEEFGFHDAEVVEYGESGGDISMLLRLCCACFDDETPYERVVFKNARITECDGLPLGGDEFSCWLFDELYYADGKIEAHMLFTTSQGLSYLTVLCDDITFQKNVMYEDDD